MSEQGKVLNAAEQIQELVAPIPDLWKLTICHLKDAKLLHVELIQSQYTSIFMGLEKTDSANV